MQQGISESQHLKPPSPPKAMPPNRRQRFDPLEMKIDDITATTDRARSVQTNLMKDQ